MHPVLLGILLGLANVVAAAVLYALGGKDPSAAGFVFAYGVLPGICAGSLLGVLAGATRTWSRGGRFIVLALPAALIVAMLGALFYMTSFIPLALVPTLLGCAVLERFSRATSASERRSSVGLAMALGAAVMLIVMAGVFNGERDASWLYEGYLPWGLGCGLGLAAPFGLVADCTRQQPIWLRRALLLALAIGLVCALATLVRVEHVIALASIPTAAGCLVLERYSRPLPAVPVAIAR